MLLDCRLLWLTNKHENLTDKLVYLTDISTDLNDRNIDEAHTLFNRIVWYGSDVCRVVAKAGLFQGWCHIHDNVSSGPLGSETGFLSREHGVVPNSHDSLGCTIFSIILSMQNVKETGRCKVLRSTHDMQISIYQSKCRTKDLVWYEILLHDDNGKCVQPSLASVLWFPLYKLTF